MMRPVHALGVLALAALGCRAVPAPAGPALPNIVLILTDDQGYGDLGCYGATDLETPHLDRLAAEGLRFTDFHVSQGVCSASRASLLTGCYSERVSIQGALSAVARIGLNPDEQTMAELLRARGYATGIFGKWHLGHRAPFLPLQQGFDESYGLPYSNDMWPVDYDGQPPGEGSPRISIYPPLHLYEQDTPGEPVQTLADQASLTERYTTRAVDFIERHADEPFFLYVPHSLPHVPLGRPLRFAGRSARGPYGDVIEEIDASVGRILAALERNGLDGNTLVIFTSDNGPWLNYGDHGGDAGGLREGKGTAWEGGARVPCVMRWPARIPPGGVSRGLASTLDLLPTLVELTGAPGPDRVIDGVSLEPLLLDPAAPSPRESFHYYYGGHLVGVRDARHKLVFPHDYRSYLGVEPGSGGHPGPYAEARSGLELYDLSVDPGETRDLASERPAIVRALEELADRMRPRLGDRLRGVTGAEVRPVGRIDPLRPSPVEHLAAGCSVQLEPAPSSKYTGGGPGGLVDGVLGSEDFTDGRWLGFQGADVLVTLDLGVPTVLQGVACSALENPFSWIFPPRAMEFEASLDGVTFQALGRQQHELGPVVGELTRTYEVACPHTRARFVRVRVAAVGVCPEWHHAAGAAAWTFLDEIVVTGEAE